MTRIRGDIYYWGPLMTAALLVGLPVAILYTPRLNHYILRPAAIGQFAPMEPGLRTYILKRVGFAVLMLVGVSIILFAIMRLAPGGPEAVLIGGEFSPEAAAQIRHRLGLDGSLALQYLGWAGAGLGGDLGRSFKTGDPVSALI